MQHTPNITPSGINAGLSVVLLYHGRKKEEELCLLAKKRGVLIDGMREYFIGKEKGKPAFVLRFSGLSKEEIQKGMKELKEAWKESGDFY